MTDPEPEDFSLRAHTEATCCICKDNTQDRRMENGVEVGELEAENCMACTKWWHPTCLPAAERLTLPLESIVDVEAGLVQSLHSFLYVRNTFSKFLRTRPGGGQPSKLSWLKRAVGARWIERAGAGCGAG
jgi:hypothetical protein